MSIVYHFTCADHGKPGITRSGLVVPHFHPFIGTSLAWFTSEAEPDREATGLGSNLARCDRMAVRFIADAALVHPWIGSVWRRGLGERTRRDLESFGDPEHWFISAVPVPVLPDLTWPAP